MVSQIFRCHRRFAQIVRSMLPWVSYSLKRTVFIQSQLKVMAKSQTLEHSKSEGNYTENIEVSIGNPLKSVKNWYNEIEHYNFHKPGYSEHTCHFTALVWKSSEWFGYGQADDSEGKTYLVARYVPAGNKEGKYRENVRRIKRLAYFLFFFGFKLVSLQALLKKQRNSSVCSFPHFCHCGNNHAPFPLNIWTGSPFMLSYPEYAKTEPQECFLDRVFLLTITFGQP